MKRHGTAQHVRDVRTRVVPDESVDGRFHTRAERVEAVPGCTRWYTVASEWNIAG